MSTLLKRDLAKGWYVAEQSGEAKIEAKAREVAGGRGDARLATYKKKPGAGAAETVDWAALGYAPLEAWLESGGFLVLEPSDDPVALADKLGNADRIAVHFPKFADGRGYSIATLLRKRVGFAGELRAVGDVLCDQLFYMSRVGFDALALRDDQDPATALNALAQFTESYQDSVDTPSPLFRRRAGALKKLAEKNLG
jgi:uncharacterized protein (DUF934 family)